MFTCLLRKENNVFEEIFHMKCPLLPIEVRKQYTSSTTKCAPRVEKATCQRHISVILSNHIIQFIIVNSIETRQNFKLFYKFAFCSTYGQCVVTILLGPNHSTFPIGFICTATHITHNKRKFAAFCSLFINNVWSWYSLQTTTWFEYSFEFYDLSFIRFLFLSMNMHTLNVIYANFIQKDSSSVSPNVCSCLPVPFGRIDVMLSVPCRIYDGKKITSQQSESVFLC